MLPLKIKYIHVSIESVVMHHPKGECGHCKQYSQVNVLLVLSQASLGGCHLSPDLTLYVTIVHVKIY